MITFMNLFVKVSDGSIRKVENNTTARINRRDYSSIIIRLHEHRHCRIIQ